MIRFRITSDPAKARFRQAEDYERAERDRSGEDPAATPYAIVCDGDHDARSTFVSYLRDNGFQAVGATNLYEFKRYVSHSLPDLIVFDAISCAKWSAGILRRDGIGHQSAIIALTSGAGEAECARMLDGGADDCMVKPLVPRELLARAHVILRRRSGGQFPKGHTELPPPGSLPKRYVFADMQFDVGGRRLVDSRKRAIPLSNTEFRLLLVFVQNSRIPLSRVEILDATRVRHDVYDRSIDVQVTRLKKKLGQALRSAIRSERGVGYIFMLPVQQEFI
jgi:two-component system OmpR family response regulator